MNQIYKIRTSFIFFIFFAFYIFVIFNLYLIQILNSKYYSQLATNQHNIKVTTLPIRQQIFDRNNSPLTLNKESFSAFILPKKLEDELQLKRFLKKHFPETLIKLISSKNKHFIYIKRRLSEKEIELIEKNKITDLKILKEPSRYYPFDYLSNIIGITDIDNKGLFGIEKEFNNQLAGSPTTFELNKEARSGHFYFKKKVAISGRDSNSITLTIDKDLQFLTQQELQETMQEFGSVEGAALIINPQNGHIISMASLPTFKSNNTQIIDQSLTKNNCITNAYEFGSVMKVFVAMAALEEKLVKPEELIDCENKTVTKIDGMQFTTVTPHGILPFGQVVENSNNIGMVKVAKRLGSKLYDHYLNFRFGKKIGVAIGGEQKGFVNNPNSWSKRSIISLSFGYEITATLLQLAQAFCIIANDGFVIKPKLIIDGNKEKFLNEKALYSQETLKTIKGILKNTVTQGTAKRADIKGYSVMGKTGTANLAINGQYSKEKNLYTFVGIVEKNDYKRVIAVYIKETNKKDMRAAQIAAPLFERIAQKLLIHDKII